MKTFYEIGAEEPLSAYITSYRESHTSERNFRNIYLITPETHKKHHAVFDVFKKIYKVDTKKSIINH